MIERCPRRRRRIFWFSKWFRPLCSAARSPLAVVGVKWIFMCPPVSTMVAPPQSYQICHRPSLRAIRHDTSRRGGGLERHTRRRRRGARVHQRRARDGSVTCRRGPKKTNNIQKMASCGHRYPPISPLWVFSGCSQGRWHTPKCVTPGASASGDVIVNQK